MEKNKTEFNLKTNKQITSKNVCVYCVINVVLLIMPVIQ